MKSVISARSNSFKIEINGTNASLNNSSTTLPNIVSADKNDLRKKDDPLPLPKYSKTSLGNLGTLKNHSWDNHNLRTPKPTSKISVVLNMDGPTKVNWTNLITQNGRSRGKRTALVNITSKSPLLI